MTPRSGFRFFSAVAALTLVSAGAFAGEEAASQSEWVKGHASRTRISAGYDKAGASPSLYAFVEIQMEPGWKTYWRNPGESGLPPRFDFTRSKNIAKAEVLYPAPMRIKDPGGDIVGYKERVIFPVKLTVKDPAVGAEVDADVMFGICKDICVPSEAALKIAVPQGFGSAPATATEVSETNLGEDNAKSLSRVPGAGSDGGPSAKSISVDVKGAKPAIKVVAAFPAGAAGADVFVEAPDGVYLPLLTKSGEDGTTLTFEADISKDVDLKALSGKTLTFTLVSDAAVAEATHKVE